MFRLAFLLTALPALLVLGAPVPGEPAPPVTPASVDAATETAYNASGTRSDSSLGLVSTRRGDPDFRGFLLGMQAAAIFRGGSPLNVAPLSAGSLAEQVEHLRGRGVETFLVDAPDGAEGRGIVDDLRAGGLGAGLITRSIPRGDRIPTVVNSPLQFATRMAEIAIQTVGGREEGPVWYIEPGWADRQKVDYPRVRRAFLQSFDAMAPHIIVQPLEPAGDPPGEAAPRVICILPPADGLGLLEELRRDYPKARIIVSGQSDDLRRAHEEGLLDIRIRPDYLGIMSQLMREISAPGFVPPFIPAGADFR